MQQMRALLRAKPEKLRVHIDGRGGRQPFRWLKCPHPACKVKHWVPAWSGQHRAQHYCCEKHCRAHRTMLRTARQMRWLRSLTREQRLAVRARARKAHRARQEKARRALMRKLKRRAA
jgi:hypothetical protein